MDFHLVTENLSWGVKTTKKFINCLGLFVNNANWLILQRFARFQILTGRHKTSWLRK